jgi:hypothetical protein
MKALLTVFARVGSFTSSDSNHLHTTVRESCVDKCRPETGEATRIPSAHVLLHGAFFPVAEPSPVMVRTSTEHNDQTSDEQSQDRYNLNRGEYELGFSVDRNGEDVQKEDDDDDDGDPYGGIVSNWKSEDVELDGSGVLTSLLGPRS